jgi:brefeldin A-inhibited guanine nucleotide-exchange protein
VDDATELARFGHVYRKDAFLVFRSMCKLSMKELPNKDVIDAKSHELRSKILSLELQLSILQSAAEVFTSDPLFIDVVIKYLCVALSKNGVSHVPAVFELSLGIFLVLLSKFKRHLKMQIEVFFKEILLSMLEISTSSFQHKWLVMVCLTKVCSDTQTVFDLYLNYDCDEYLNNIFERMINDVSRVSQGRASSELGGTPQQEFEMKVKGMECLVLILRCMRDWSDADEMKEATKLAIAAASGGADDSDDEDEPPAPGALGKAASVNSLNEEGADGYEHRKKLKDTREKGIKLFNKKPKKGVAFLQENGMLGTEAGDIADFFLKEGEGDRVDKTMIGEYLGEPGEFNLAVMHAYTDKLDFNDDFVGSLRIFLGGFRLPGEAQKIDRLMEKFAGSWFGANPTSGVFASADTAYVLAYSTIMLTTDLHSVKIKKKMTLDEFIRNNRGINDSKDLPREFLEGVFSAIEKEEIKMKGAQVVKTSIADVKNKKERADFVATQMEGMQKNAEETMKSVEGSNAVFLSASSVEQAKPMFQVAHMALLAALTRPMQESQDNFVISLCLEGLRSSIHIASIFGLEEARTFLQSLAKFTNLSSNLSEIKHKHVEAVKTLLAIGAEEGNYLGDSWNEILRCVSQLELAALLGNTIEGRHKNIPDTLTETASQNIVVSVDRIFANSQRLNGEAIVCFVRWLCHTSLAELQQKPPRLFSLSKLVDIAYYNMERIRLEWSHIWAIMGEHFNKVGCMHNTDVANFAVDSLRQLSIKFLEKGELANYSFQKDFLRPFEYIMSHNKAVSIRDMVVCCVAQMVQAKATNIRSGWKNIFFVFSLAASDNDQNIVDLAFSSTKLIFENHFSKKNVHRASLITGSFMDAVNCLSEFASNSFFPDISMEAIRLLRECATHVHESPELFELPNEDASNEPTIWVRGWFPVLFGLSRIVLKCKLDVRTRALTVMMDIMKSYGESFLTQWWKDIFDVLNRVFDDNKLKSMQTEQEMTDWMNTTCNHALRSIVDVVSVFFDKLQDVLLKDTFALLEWCIHRDNEQLARTATECLHILVMNNGVKFSDGSWEITVNFIRKFFDTTAPKALMDFRQDQVMDESGEKPAKLDEAGKQKQQAMFASIIIKCVVQLELIQTVKWILLSSTEVKAAVTAGGDADSEQQTTDLNERREKERQLALARPVSQAGEIFECLSSERLLMLLDCLMDSHRFARAFNADKATRNALWKAGFMRNKSKPNLMKQEKKSLSCALRIMFRMYESKSRESSAEEIGTRIMRVCKETLAHYVQFGAKEARDIWAPLVSLVLQELLRLDDAQFAQHAKLHYDICTKILVVCFDQSIGQVAFFLCEFFKRAKGCALVTLDGAPKEVVVMGDGE